MLFVAEIDDVVNDNVGRLEVAKSVSEDVQEDELDERLLAQFLFQYLPLLEHREIVAEGLWIGICEVGRLLLMSSSWRQGGLEELRPLRNQIDGNSELHLLVSDKHVCCVLEAVSTALT